MKNPQQVEETVPMRKMSIVVPCYNTAALLPRCFDSLLAQTLDDFEVICVNDGSPDNCFQIIQDYVSRYPHIFRCVDKANGGLWNARWSGTDVAQGEYVAYLDSDDFVEPDFAKDFYTAAKTCDAQLVVCGFRRVEEGTERVLSTEMHQPKAPFVPAQEPGRLVEINPAAWNKCFKRSLLARMRRLQQPPAILEDVTLSQLAYLACDGPVAFTGTAPYNYLIRQGSMINTVTVPQVESVKTALLEVRQAYLDEGASQGLRHQLDATVFLHLGVSMSFRLSCNPDVNLGEAIQQTTKYLDNYFTTWRKNPYISRQAAKQGGAYQKLLLSQLFYKAHLMGPFLGAYRFAIEKLHREIKW